MSLRSLPSVDAVARALADLPAAVAVGIARRAVDEARAVLLEGGQADALELARRQAAAFTLRRPARVINATGVLLHTNLGRAPLHPDAAAAASKSSTTYGNVEFDLATGRRGGRTSHVRELLVELTGAESAAVVNNNAAGLLLALAALAHGREVPVSRGELIEIGGSYRLPELMSASGAVMVEVGTTNRTRLADYVSAMSTATAMTLKVHPSNYRVVGFNAETTSGELIELSAEQGVPFVYDVGSGLIDEQVPWLGGPPPAWLESEPGLRQELAAGADLVLASGDKLLGGPQAGLILGRTALIERLTSHPMARALRVSGATLAALGVTLELYLDGRADEIPFWAMAARSVESLTDRLTSIQEAIGFGAIEPSASLPGAGSVPGLTMPSPIIAIDGSADRWWDHLLAGPIPIVARREAGRVFVDVRAVDPADDRVVIECLRSGAATCR